MIDNYWTLVALRYAAESVDEVNVFLAKALEIQLRQQRLSAGYSIAAFVSGAGAALLGSFIIGDAFLVPGLILTVYLAFMAVATAKRYCEIKEQQESLTIDEKSIKDYLRKAGRDRLENKVAVSIQNRRAAARSLKYDSLDDEDRKSMQAAVKFWGERIEAERGHLDEQGKDSALWIDEAARWQRIRSWITEELDARPLEHSD